MIGWIQNFLANGSFRFTKMMRSQKKLKSQNIPKRLNYGSLIYPVVINDLSVYCCQWHQFGSKRYGSDLDPKGPWQNWRMDGPICYASECSKTSALAFWFKPYSYSAGVLVPLSHAHCIKDLEIGMLTSPFGRVDAWGYQVVYVPTALLSNRNPLGLCNGTYAVFPSWRRFRR